MLILRGKRIGLSLQEIRELFALYDAAHDDAPQLQEFIRILARKGSSFWRRWKTSRWC